MDSAPLDMTAMSNVTKITHFREALDACKKQIFNLYPSFDIVCSDMNAPVKKMPDVIASLSPLVRAGGWLVVTLKFKHQLPQAATTTPDCVQALTDFIKTQNYAFCQCLWLFANSSNERTVVARKGIFVFKVAF